jgi:hypothetical protein
MRLTSLLVLLTLLVPAAAADAKKKHPRHHKAGPPKMQLLSRAANGGFPNGPSHNGNFSQDRQLATYAAFDSDASNIVSGDSNGVTDVFIVRRARPYSDKGEAWKRGTTHLVSRAPNGGPANGPSYLPDLDGEQTHRPRCIAFVSEASNLVPNDTNGVADAFVKDLHTGRIQRVSVGSHGEQADGPTSEVKVDGHCDRVAFVAQATNLGLADTAKPAWKSAVTSAPAPGTRQVYVRVLGRNTDNAGLKGLTFLASANGSGEPANGDSYDLAFARSGGGCGRQARCGDFSGEAVFFASDATNLSPDDQEPGADIYRRSFDRAFVRMRFPTRRHVDGELVRATLVGVGPLRMRTRLLSITRKGHKGNGPSDQPATTDSGHYVVFRTAASNLVAGDHNEHTDVLRLDTREDTFSVVSRTRHRALGNGDSGAPAIGRTGEDVVFESSASNLNPNDKNCTGDVYHMDFPANNQILSSLDSRDHVPNAPYGTTAPCPAAIAAPVVHPAASYYLNYMLVEGGFPLLDYKLGKKLFPKMSSTRAARISTTDSAMHQVYLRYLSPR